MLHHRIPLYPMSMLEAASEDSYISPDAYLLFTMKDGALVYRMSKTFTIEDALFGKIKNIFKNMHSYADVLQLVALGGKLGGFVFVVIHDMYSFHLFDEKL